VQDAMANSFKYNQSTQDRQNAPGLNQSQFPAGSNGGDDIVVSSANAQTHNGTNTGTVYLNPNRVLSDDAEIHDFLPSSADPTKVWGSFDGWSMLSKSIAGRTRFKEALGKLVITKNNADAEIDLSILEAHYVFTRAPECRVIASILFFYANDGWRNYALSAETPLLLKGIVYRLDAVPIDHAMESVTTVEYFRDIYNSHSDEFSIYESYLLGYGISEKQKTRMHGFLDELPTSERLEFELATSEMLKAWVSNDTFLPHPNENGIRRHMNLMETNQHAIMTTIKKHNKLVDIFVDAYIVAYFEKHDNKLLRMLGKVAPTVLGGMQDTDMTKYHVMKCPRTFLMHCVQYYVSEMIESGDEKICLHQPESVAFPADLSDLLGVVNSVSGRVNLNAMVVNSYMAATYLRSIVDDTSLTRDAMTKKYEEIEGQLQFSKFMNSEWNTQCIRYTFPSETSFPSLDEEVQYLTDVGVLTDTLQWDDKNQIVPKDLTLPIFKNFGQFAEWMKIRAGSTTNATFGFIETGTDQLNTGVEHRKAELARTTVEALKTDVGEDDFKTLEETITYVTEHINIDMSLQDFLSQHLDLVPNCSDSATDQAPCYFQDHPYAMVYLVTNSGKPLVVQDDSLLVFSHEKYKDIGCDIALTRCILKEDITWSNTPVILNGLVDPDNTYPDRDDGTHDGDEATTTDVELHFMEHYLPDADKAPFAASVAPHIDQLALATQGLGSACVVPTTGVMDDIRRISETLARKDLTEAEILSLTAKFNAIQGAAASTQDASLNPRERCIGYFVELDGPGSFRVHLNPACSQPRPGWVANP
jgi:hypothetical protein